MAHSCNSGTKNTQEGGLPQFLRLHSEFKAKLCYKVKPCLQKHNPKSRKMVLWLREYMALTEDLSSTQANGQQGAGCTPAWGSPQADSPPYSCFSFLFQDEQGLLWDGDLRTKQSKKFQGKVQKGSQFLEPSSSSEQAFLLRCPGYVLYMAQCPQVAFCLDCAVSVLPSRL